MAVPLYTRTRLGRDTELRASLWLAANGYEVFANVFPDGPIDLVAIRLHDGEFLKIDVKTASTRLSKRQVELGVHLLVLDRTTGDFRLLTPEEAAPRGRARRVNHDDLFRRERAERNAAAKAAKAEREARAKAEWAAKKKAARDAREAVLRGLVAQPCRASPGGAF